MCKANYVSSVNINMSRLSLAHAFAKVFSAFYSMDIARLGDGAQKELDSQ